MKLKMTLPMVRKRIENAGLDIFIERRLPDNMGTQIVTIKNHVINVYDSGSVVVQGVNRDQMENILTQIG